MVITKRFIWIAVAVLIVLLGVLAIGDLDYTISRAIINPDSLWANFFNVFGELPATLGILIGITILFGGRQKDKKWRNILGYVFSIPFMMLFSFFAVFAPVNYHFEHHPDGIPMVWMAIIAVLAVALFVAALLIIKKVGNEKMREMRKVGLVFLLLVIVEMIMFNIIKITWARPRMRSFDSIDGFVHWYKINGPTFDNELMSFPSGHTANSFVALAYIMFVPYFKKIKKNWFMVFAIAWGTAVALSRVVLGAHFLSDVLVGSYISIFAFFIIYGIIFRNKKKGNA